jgi:hypothetical protein
MDREDKGFFFFSQYSILSIHEAETSLAHFRVSELRASTRAMRPSVPSTASVPTRSRVLSTYRTIFRHAREWPNPEDAKYIFFFFFSRSNFPVLYSYDPPFSYNCLRRLQFFL